MAQRISQEFDNHNDLVGGIYAETNDITIVIFILESKKSISVVASGGKVMKREDFRDR